MQGFESKKRQILDRIDVLDVVSEHVSLKRQGRRWLGLCPFHTEKTPSFTVNPELGIFKCFGCGKGGDVFSFVQLRENITFMEALRILADRAGVELAEVRGGSGDGPGRADLAKVNAWAAAFFRASLMDERTGRQTRAYLQDRRLGGAIIERFGLGLATGGSPGLVEAARRAGFSDNLLISADLLRSDEHGRAYHTFRSRLMFPIRDATRRVVGFGGRTLVDDRAKYLNTRQNALFDKGRGLYGLDLARDSISAKRRAIVVEGYTDCMAAHQAGFTETVATLGTALTDAQVDLLRRYADEMILLFDSDEAGEAAADRAIRVALPRCVAVRLAHVPDAKDPCEFLTQEGHARFSDVLNGAVDALEFKWCQTRDRFDANVSDARRREAVLDFLRIVADAFGSGVVDEITRGQLVLQVARLLHMDVVQVEQQMRRQTRGRVPAADQRAPGNERWVWVAVLEVLLNRPDLLEMVEYPPGPLWIADERDLRIARVLFDLAKDGPDWKLKDVLIRCHEPADLQRVIELAEQGRQKEGTYEQTLENAVRQIRDSLADRQIESCKRELLGVLASGGPSEEADRFLADYQRRLNDRRRSFCGRRFTNRPVDPSERNETKDARLEQP